MSLCHMTRHSPCGSPVAHGSACLPCAVAPPATKEGSQQMDKHPTHPSSKAPQSPQQQHNRHITTHRLGLDVVHWGQGQWWKRPAAQMKMRLCEQMLPTRMQRAPIHHHHLQCLLTARKRHQHETRNFCLHPHHRVQLDALPMVVLRDVARHVLPT
jgi:hypothetical protein